MQVSVTFNFDNIRKKNLYLSDKYKSTWSDPDNPTNEELSKAIKDEIFEELKNDSRISTFEITN